MAKFKMKQLVLAMGMVGGGIALTPSAQAVHLASDGLGQALIFPYYTVRNGWNTLLNITNTSNQVVAAKVRFHEARNSRDVFDFNLFLSPQDVWSGTLSIDPGPDGQVGTSDDLPRFSTNDNSCTAPGIPDGGVTFPSTGQGSLSYTNSNIAPAADGAGTTNDRMLEGYVVIQMMGSADDLSISSAWTPLAANAIHGNDGVPLDCSALINAFNSPGYSYSANGTTASPIATPVPAGIESLQAEFPNYVINPLKGAFSLVKGSEGWNASGSAVALMDFYAGSNNPTTSGEVNNLVTFQLPPQDLGDNLAISFHEPDLSSANTFGRLLSANGQVAESSTTGAAAVTFALLRTNVQNQWAQRTNPANGWLVSSDWVITYPTKRFHVDQATHQFAGHASGRANLPGLAPFSTLFTTDSGFAGRSCDGVTYRIYNREELVSSSGPVFSPAPAGSSLCFETNVITFGGSDILGSAIASNVSDLPGENGWVDLVLSSAITPLGLPAVGFTVITRATPDGMLNEAFIVDHAYTRP